MDECTSCGTYKVEENKKVEHGDMQEEGMPHSKI